MDDTTKIRFHCPHCGKSLRANPKLIGRKLPCPKCSGEVRVPEQNIKADITAKNKVQLQAGHSSERTKIRCPHCGKRFVAKKSALGKKFPCPACSEAFVLTSSSIKTNRKDSPQKTHVQVTEHVPKVNYKNNEKDRDVDEDWIIQGDRYIEVEDDEGKLLRYYKVEKFREALLSGIITRHNKARHIHPEPKIEHFSSISDKNRQTYEHKKAYKKWSKVQLWRPIGEVLVKEIDEIRSLYEPYIVCMKSGAIAGFGICFIVVFIIFLVFAIIAAFAWDPSEATPDRPFTPGAPGAGATIKFLEKTPVISNIIAVLLYGVIAFLAAVVVGFVLGYPIGGGIGFLVYLTRKDSYPHPPPDGYKKNIFAFSFISNS